MAVVTMHSPACGPMPLSIHKNHLGILGGDDAEQPVVGSLGLGEIAAIFMPIQLFRRRFRHWVYRRWPQTCWMVSGILLINGDGDYPLFSILL